MKKVYLVMREVDYEGSEVTHIFSTEIAANIKCEKLAKDEQWIDTRFSVEEWEVE
jgi:hypothetical protein